MPRIQSPPFYQLEVALLHTRKPVWRRLLVPGDANLGWLHAVIQVAMGWTNSHLHRFLAGKDSYSDTRVCYAEFEDDPAVFEERKTKLDQLLVHRQQRLIYIYDFGDTWEHTITLDDLLYSEPGVKGKARCLAGERACPPEDCGGPPGFDNFLQAIKDRRHPDHQMLTEWLGRPYDEEAFDLARTNHWLDQLKWPNVTENQLRKVLMARDGYRE